MSGIGGCAVKGEQPSCGDDATARVYGVKKLGPSGNCDPQLQGNVHERGTQQWLVQAKHVLRAADQAILRTFVQSQGLAENKHRRYKSAETTPGPSDDPVPGPVPRPIPPAWHRCHADRAAAADGSMSAWRRASPRILPGADRQISPRYNRKASSPHKGCADWKRQMPDGPGRDVFPRGDQNAAKVQTNGTSGRRLQRLWGRTGERGMSQPAEPRIPDPAAAAVGEEQ